MKSLLKQTLLSIILLGSGAFVSGQDLPQPSQKQTLTQRVGLTDITIEYSRPSAKGRTIFGDLVPYGEIWRTGANAATSIEFNSPISLNGQLLEAGKYALFTIPAEDGNWKVIVNENYEQWGTGDYDEALNKLSLDVKAQKSNGFVETLTIGFNEVIGDNAVLNLSWENTSVSVAINADSKAMAMANIEEKMQELNSGHSAYNGMARYFLGDGNDPAKALEMATKSVEIDEKFWNVKTLSEAYAANGDYKMAISTAEKSLAMSKEADYAPYIKMNEKNLKDWKSKK